MQGYERMFSPDLQLLFDSGLTLIALIFLFTILITIPLIIVLIIIFSNKNTRHNGERVTGIKEEFDSSDKSDAEP